MVISQQKGCRVPIHIQSAVEKEVQKIIDCGHIERITEVGADTFVSPVVITHKKKGTLIIALDLVELNGQITMKTMQLPAQKGVYGLAGMPVVFQTKSTRYSTTKSPHGKTI